jgi:hypothetical protein
MPVLEGRADRRFGPREKEGQGVTRRYRPVKLDCGSAEDRAIASAANGPAGT